MACKDVIEFLADYLDGTLPWRQRLLFKVHLFFCRHCRQYLTSYRATVQIAQSIGGGTRLQAAAEPVPDELVRAILAAQRGSFRSGSGSQSSASEP